MYSLKWPAFIPMEFFRVCVVIALLLPNAASVTLNSEGEYENLIINIDPEVQDLTFLNKSMTVMASFSKILFSKTNGRFSIKNMIVVLPPVYNEETLDVEKDKIEDLHDETLPKKASILVSPANGSHIWPSLKTVHLGGCGQPGEYIQISPEMFGTNRPLNRSTAYLLLHEWAHYRWGLFDEYGTSGEDSDSPFYLTPNKTIKPITCPGNLKGWMLTRDLKPCGRSQDLLPQTGCHFHLYYNESDPPLSSLMMGYAVYDLDEFCGSRKIQHNPSPPSPHNKRCYHQSAFEILLSHPDFIKIPEKHEARVPPKHPKVIFLKRKTLVNNKTVIVIFYYPFQDEKTPVKIKAALNLVKKYGDLSKFKLCYEDAVRSNMTDVIEKYSKRNATVPNKSLSLWIVTDEDKIITQFAFYDGVNFLLPKRQKDTTPDEELKANMKDKAIKTFPEKLSTIEIASSFIEYVIKRILPDENVPGQIYKHLFTNNEDVKGSFILDSSCRDALFIASEVETFNGSSLTGNLRGPGGEYCSSALPKHSELGSSPCSGEKSVSLLTFRLSEGNWTRGKWSYHVNVSSYDAISVMLVCRLDKKSLQIIPRLFTKSPDASNTFNASVKNNIVILAVSVLYDAKPVLHASVYADVSSEHAKDAVESSIPLEDNGIGHDVRDNDGVYTNEFLNFKGNGHYSFSFSVNINGSSGVLNHQQFLNVDDKKIPVVAEFGGRHMNYPSFTIRDVDWKDFFDRHGEPKSEFSYEELTGDSSTNEPKVTPKEKMHLEEQERTSEPLTVEVVQYEKNFQEGIAPGQVTDLKVTEMSYSLSFVTLEWTSVGAHGFSGTADTIELKFTSNGSAFPSNFHDLGSSVHVNETHLMDGSSLRPLRARTKHNVSVKVPKMEGKSYQEDAIYFFALAYWDKVDNVGLVSNVVYAFFKPEKYSDEIKEIKSQHRSGGLIILAFLFFIGFLGVFICGIKWYHKTRQHDGFTPEQIIKYSK